MTPFCHTNKKQALLHEEWVNFKAERWFEPLFKGIC
jgi:hypothetical protein